MCDLFHIRHPPSYISLLVCPRDSTPRGEKMKPPTKLRISAATGFLFLILSCAVVFAQSTAQINGTVKDQSGAVLPGVEVTVIQTDTGVQRSMPTDETGSY